MPRALTYAIQRQSWMPEHNAPLVYFEVWCGDSPRDYAAVDYRPRKIVAKFKTIHEAETFVSQKKGA